MLLTPRGAALQGATQRPPQSDARPLAVAAALAAREPPPMHTVITLLCNLLAHLRVHLLGTLWEAYSLKSGMCEGQGAHTVA